MTVFAWVAGCVRKCWPGIDFAMWEWLEHLFHISFSVVHRGLALYNFSARIPCHVQFKQTISDRLFFSLVCTLWAEFKDFHSFTSIDSARVIISHSTVLIIFNLLDEVRKRVVQ